jgi:hypothetical protein
MKKTFYIILLLSFTWISLFAQEGMLSTGKIPSMKIERTHTVANQLDNPTNIAYGFSNLQNLTLSMPIPGGTPFTYLSNWYSSNFASSMCKGCIGYYLVDITPALYSFDEFSGIVQYLGSITGMNGDQPTGIGFNPVDRNFYMVSSSNFYSLDIETHVATLIGPLNLTSGGLMIDLCFDLSGTCYAYEINVSTASAYTINITTGNATAIGMLGYNPNFGQGMSYDFETNTIYLSAFNGVTMTGQLRTMDPATGMTTLITDWGYEQIDPFVIANSGMILCPCWIGNPYNPNPPSGSTNINISGTTLSWTNGVYTSSVELWFGGVGYLTKVYDGPVITSWPLTGWLNYETTYQWKVVCKNDTCSTYGPTWSFTTVEDPNLLFDSTHVHPQLANYWTGTCNASAKTQVSLVNASGNDVGWMVFDLSSIPDYKVIQEVTFYGYVYSNNWPYWSITPMNSIVPMTDNAPEIFNQIITNYAQGISYSYNQEPGTLPNGWLSKDLENNVLIDLQAALPQDYFAIGIVDFDFNLSYYVDFQGWSELNKPYLVIIYDECLMGLNPPSNFIAQIIYNPDPQVQLNWQDNSGEEGFKIYRKSIIPNQQTFYKLIGTVSNNTTQFLDTTVFPESEYCYRVFAFNICGSSGSDTATIAVPIPVELISFTTEVDNNVVALFWQTATETNNKGFEIQRKSGGEFETLAFIEGYGTTTETHTYSYSDRNVNAGSYNYRLKQIDFDGSVEYSSEIEAEVKAPNVFSLEQNYPNPFNPATKIKYTIPNVTLRQAQSDILVTLKVYDILGNEVATLVNEEQIAGEYEVELNVTTLPSGVYFYQLKAGSFVETKKMLLLK